MTKASSASICNYEAFWRSITYGDRWRAGRVLLTGATGFLGVYVLRDLLNNTQVSIHLSTKSQ